MKKHQVDSGSADLPARARAWRGDREETARNAACARKLSEERRTHKDLVDRKRAEYLQRHDDDEAELDLPR